VTIDVSEHNVRPIEQRLELGAVRLELSGGERFRLLSCGFGIYVVLGIDISSEWRTVARRFSTPWVRVTRHPFAPINVFGHWGPSQKSAGQPAVACH
jgi:hypothetical protein